MSPRTDNSQEIERSLLALLLAEGPAAERAAALIGQMSAWPRAIDLAIAWGVVPHLYQRLGQEPSGVDPEAAQRLRAAAVAVAIRSGYAAKRAGEVLDGFRQAGVRAAAFKGVGLIANLYRRPGDRQVSDADLLTREQDVPRAYRVLTDLGFAPSFSAPLGAYLDFMHRRPYLDNAFLVVRDGRGLEIDLHWCLGTTPAAGRQTEAILERVEFATLGGRRIPVVTPEDAILLTVHHALRNQLTLPSVAKELCDLRSWCVLRSDAWDLASLVERADYLQLAAGLLALWRLLGDLGFHAAAREGIAYLESRLSTDSVRDAMRLEDLFWLQLRDGTMSRDFLRLLKPRTIGRLIMSRLHSPREGRRLRVAMSASDPQAYTQHRRFGRLAATLSRLTPRRFAAYRTLARVQETALSPPTGDAA